jgi:bifunctional N-acetylglucosamine-1-phosphate-uridyltransferase/glucosamine-1-phosphate-acetyltransferase GlmU-like protein
MEDNTVAAVILAAGKGTRINSRNINKVVYPFVGKPMILYGVDLFKDIAERVVIVIGAYSQSVKDTLKNRNVLCVYQKLRLGTGHAAKVGLQALLPYSPTLVLIGYGDHLMFYKKDTIKKLIALHEKEKAAVSIITAEVDDPDKMAFGRIIRDKDGYVIRIVEQKDATSDERKIKEFNAGLYCFNYEFLKRHIDSLKRSSVTNEYYLTDMVHEAVKHNKKVAALKVPFAEVGIGVNRHEDLEQGQRYYLTIHKT